MTDLGWIFMAIGIICLIIGYGFWNHITNLKIINNKIKESWGERKDVSELDNRDFSLISSYFENTKYKSEFYIDDITWNDLNMKEVFNCINRAYTSVGEEFLYYTLRTPLFRIEDLKFKDNITNELSSNLFEREKIAFLLANLGKSKKSDISSLFTLKSITSKSLLIYRILSILPLVFLGLFFINKIWIVFVIGSITLNAFLHLANFKDKSYLSENISYVIEVIKCANEIANKDFTIINKYFPNIKESIGSIKDVTKGIFSISNSNSLNELDIIGEYFKMFFLMDIITLEKASLIIEKNTDYLIEIYKFIGMIDLCISIGSYRESLDYYCRPGITLNSNVKNLEFKDIYHPLIEDPVSNSCNIKKSILLTGSNASGKSTFLRTLAINSILGQTIYTCLSNSYTTSFFKIYTSMALKDNIFSNDSYYIAEIKSLKRIIDEVDGDIPCLCFIDEVLRGTNTIERIAASSEVLNYIGNRNSICIGATHDLELTNILECVFNNYHFQEYIEDDQVVFDYKLYSGKSETRNAIRLLRLLEYEDEIVNKAEYRARVFSETGLWEKIKNN
ncbi:MAG: DNA mismatch repair protein MutS [Clostridium sp.]